MEKQNIKIKRSKGRLYKKRKSAGRRVAEIILMVLVVGILGVVGYSAAGPLISYFRSEGGEPGTTPWEPPESSTPEESENSDTSDTSDTSESESTTTTRPVFDGSGAYLLPVNALADQSMLFQALSVAESSGCSIIIVTVKDDDGHLLYGSQIPSVKDTEIVTGSMTAAQIVSAVKERGFTGIKALVPVLYDRTTPIFVQETGYRFADDSYAWLDAAADRGGKQWVDPFRSGTRTYYTQLARELTEAGFDEVLLSELKFPQFTTYDLSILDPRNFSDTRYTALTSLYSSVSSAVSNKAAVSVNITDVLSGYGNSFVETAEILSDKSFTGTVYLMTDLSAFGTSLATGDNVNMTLPADPAQKAQALVSKAVSYIGTNVTVVPVIKTGGISVEALSRCYEALKAE